MCVGMYVCMYVCMSTFSNIFSSETNGPIETKFHLKSSKDRETKVYSNGPDHMTQMSTMLIFSKNLKKKLLLRNPKADDLET